MRNLVNVKGTDLSSSYFPAPAYNGANIQVSTSLSCNILNQKAMMMFKMAICSYGQLSNDLTTSEKLSEIA